MAYFSQARKQEMSPKIKDLCRKYGIKATLAVARSNSTVSLNVKSGSIDFIGNYNKTVAERPGGFRTGSPAVDSLQVNPYWYQETFSGPALEFIREALQLLNDGNHDNSDSQVDYFDVGWYVDVNIGRWNKPYILEC